MNNNIMMHADHLAEFVSNFEEAGLLVRISSPVETQLEIAAITEQVVKTSPTNSAPALLFDQVAGHKIPVLTNLYGSLPRMLQILHTDSLDSIADRVAGLLSPDLPEGWLDSLKMIPQFSQLVNIKPRIVKTASCQQVVKLGRDVNLSEFPLLTCWPEEQFPTITAAQIITFDPETKARFVNARPIQVISNQQLAIRWSQHDAGYQLLQKFHARGQQLPVAIVIGGDPVGLYTAHAPLPKMTDPYAFGGFLRNNALELVRARSIEIDVPAQAEIVMEGFIDPASDPVDVGPVANTTGYYSPAEKVMPLNLSAVTHRANPIWHALIPAGPPAEAGFFAQATERIFLPLLKLMVPELVDIHFPAAGAGRYLMFVSIHKSYPQQARRVVNALWSLESLLSLKLIVVVDDDVNVHDEQQVWYRVSTNLNPGRDLIHSEGPGDDDDHSAAIQGIGHKLGLDATRKTPSEGHPREWPSALKMPAEMLERVQSRLSELGLS
ncbi:UbiD family decarboxylase [Gimesia maris]|uniref:UbiD family decarboxylase n=1 Tax=Gimesia maris TaxID=122 RepID=UPI0030D9ED7A|tara:strand:+ start:60230 stop:61711 length:1482 start_codon:yes stop_codon:yes gene_type:complete